MSDFRYKKSMGQNFLVDPNTQRRIAEASLAEADGGVLEIGPGGGAITAILAQMASKIVAVELDRGLEPALTELTAKYKNVEIVWADILKTDIKALAVSKLPEKRVVCANLPYNITTPAIAALLDSAAFDTITLMVQKEVAARVVSPPGTKEYGAFSVYVTYMAGVEVLFDVPPDCFFPKPKVTSAVLRLTPRRHPDEAKDQTLFFKVVKSAFETRRKTLSNCLLRTFGQALSKDQIAHLLDSLSLPQDVRGERLSVAQFAALSNLLQEVLPK